MSLLVIGLSHHTAPIEVLERVDGHPALQLGGLVTHPEGRDGMAPLVQRQGDHQHRHHQQRGQGVGLK